jgi:hypothetical protein
MLENDEETDIYADLDESDLKDTNEEVRKSKIEFHHKTFTNSLVISRIPSMRKTNLIWPMKLCYPQNKSNKKSRNPKITKTY